MIAEALIGGVLVLFLMRQKEKDAVVEKQSLQELYEKHAKITGLPASLIRAVAIVESNENPNAENTSDPSFGLMQLLCTVDKSGERVCKNVLHLPDWPPKSMQQLKEPDYNIGVGSQILAWNIKTYGLRKGIAVYNNWSARLQSEPFSNQSYLDKVWSEFTRLNGDELSV